VDSFLQHQKKWFHESGLIKLQPDEKEHQENSILFTITYFLLYSIINHKLVLDHIKEDGNITTSRSHDNMTAIITYFAHHNLGARDRIKIFPDYTHPRDILYIAYVQRRFWVYPFLPLLYLVFLWTALTKYKKRNGKKILKTDTEILYWVRLQLPKKYWFMHFTAKTIVPLLQRRFGKDYAQGMFDIYYRNAEHPNRNYKPMASWSDGKPLH
jgi:hypothetical protein